MINGAKADAVPESGLLVTQLEGFKGRCGQCLELREFESHQTQRVAPPYKETP